MSGNGNETDNSKEVYEFLRNFLLVTKGNVSLLCGSSFELPIQYVIANATDVDIMYIPTDICALPVNVSAPQNFQGKTLVVTTEDTHPGFARLYSPDYQCMFRRNANTPDNHYRHGPAWTTTMMICPECIHVINEVFGNLGSSRYREICSRFQEMKMDRVFAICCPYWPNEANEWKARDRLNGWPPTEVIDKVVASGCYFVAKPHQSCPEDDTQWRFSFSQAEVILIHSWTDAQKYIYHILRLIKSDVVKACGGSEETVLCTYFFKTLMFWECERKPKEFWEDENVETSIRELLCTMIGWLIDGRCPNYFIPESNMLSAATNRVHFTNEIQLLLIYTESCRHVRQIATMLPKAYPKDMIGQLQVVVTENFLLHFNLVQIRDHHLNLIYPKTNTNLMKHLTEGNSLLWRKASDLYKGILNHIQLMKTSCPIQKCHFKRRALSHFKSSLMETGYEYSTRIFSIGESIYENLQRLNSATDCKIQSVGAHNNIRTGSCDLHLRGYCRPSQVNTSVECCNNTHGRFAHCYSHLLDSEKDDVDVDSKVKSSATIENLNTSIKMILQTFFANSVRYVSTATQIISSAYLANFYFTVLQDYNEAFALCEKIVNFPGKKADLVFYERAFPIFITNESSPIFDEHFRTVLGLVTLHRSMVGSLQDSSTVLVRIRPAQFLKYLMIQCKRFEGVDDPEISNKFESSDVLYKWYDTYEPLSEVFMSAVTSAGRSKCA